MATGQTLIESQAKAGLELFAATEEGPLVLDTASAAAYKADMEARIATLEEESAKLTGKDNKKERAAKGKEIAELKGEAKYVDACKVVRGLEPKHGFFAQLPEGHKSAADAKREPRPPQKVAEVIEVPVAPAQEKKESRKPKKEEAPGLSQAEMKELDKLKADLISRKTQLKEQGLSGSQQNKDPQVLEWVARMNELKEKLEPGSTEKDTKKKDTSKTKAPLSMDEQKEMDQLRGEIEAYKGRLKNEFGYSNKDIKADQDLQEMEQKLAAFEKRS